ncbi:MAG: hypothetical protein AAB308_00155 [Nitrospirota bacterium]
MWRVTNLRLPILLRLSKKTLDAQKRRRIVEAVIPVVESMGLSIWREKIDKNGVHRYISKQAF